MGSHYMNLILFESSAAIDFIVLGPAILYFLQLMRWALETTLRFFYMIYVIHSETITILADMITK